MPRIAWFMNAIRDISGTTIHSLTAPLKMNRIRRVRGKIDRIRSRRLRSSIYLISAYSGSRSGSGILAVIDDFHQADDRQLLVTLPFYETPVAYVLEEAGQVADRDSGQAESG